MDSAYRNDLAASHARIAQLEAEVKQLKRKNSRNGKWAKSLARRISKFRFSISEAVFFYICLGMACVVWLALVLLFSMCIPEQKEAARIENANKLVVICPVPRCEDISSRITLCCVE